MTKCNVSSLTTQALNTGWPTFIGRSGAKGISHLTTQAGSGTFRFVGQVAKASEYSGSVKETRFQKVFGQNRGLIVNPAGRKYFIDSFQDRKIH